MCAKSDWRGTQLSSKPHLSTLALGPQPQHMAGNSVPRYLLSIQMHTPWHQPLTCPDLHPVSCTQPWPELSCIGAPDRLHKGRTPTGDHRQIVPDLCVHDRTDVGAACTGQDRDRSSMLCVPCCAGEMPLSHGVQGCTDAGAACATWGRSKGLCAAIEVAG